MIFHTNYVTTLSFITLLLIAPGWSDADQNVDNSAITFGEKIEMDHHGRSVSGPALQLSESGKLHLAWIQDDNNDLNTYYVQSPLTQHTLPQPIRVNPATTHGDSLHAPPALALGPKNDVYMTWTTPYPNAKGKPFSSLLLLSRSLDGGKTFLPPVRVNDDETVTGHSFDHLTVSPNGSIHIVWIDAREGRKNISTYSSFSKDQGHTLSPNLKIDESTCVCCRAHATAAPDGTVYLAWRKILPGGVRETVVARSTDNGQSYSASVIVGHDQWVYAGCPHRPATMGVDQHGRLYVAWYTEGPDENPGVYLAYSDDQGRTFTPRQRLNVSRGTFPDHPQLAVNREGHLLVTWEEQSPVRREVVLSYSLDRGQSFSVPKKLNKKKAKHPTVALNDKGQAVIAWLEQVSFPGWSTVIQPIAVADPPTSIISSTVR